jgi:hypothetical protein
VQTLIGNVDPVGASEHDGVTSSAAVRRCDQTVRDAPRVERPGNGNRGKIGAIGEDDDRDLYVTSQRCEAAAQGGSGPTGPVRATDDAIGRVRRHAVARREGMGTFDDDDLVDGCQAQSSEDVWEEKSLLGESKPRGFPGGEHHCRDLAHA